MKLPDRFLSRMNVYFKDHDQSDYDGFVKSFEERSVFGLRVNRLKVIAQSDRDVLSKMGMDHDPVPWCPSGYYVDETVSGNDPYSHAGVFYQQEPSAMLPAEILAAKPGERVLDLCAAPGGKTTRIAEMLHREGFLVANDISSDRCRALLRNMERMGIDDAVILNETPERLADYYGAFFDKILIDAPCSGEGMFRRDTAAVKSWERYGVETTVKMQKEILIQADRMLRPGGSIVYSTCTFSQEENERMAEWFIDKRIDYKIVPHEQTPDVSFSSVSGIPYGAIRIWPHISRGEGHFCVHLQKNGGADSLSMTGNEKNGGKALFRVPEAVIDFFGGLLVSDASDRYLKRIEKFGYGVKDRIHFHNGPDNMYNGLRTVKVGAYCGDIKHLPKKSVFLPSSSLTLSLRKEEVRPERFVSLGRNDNRTARYLRGETIFLDSNERKRVEDRDYVVIAVDSYPLGFAKASGGVLKNLYPKSWRRL
ncbi:MAG: SAM-dependent methyltransferase [Clostridiales bacterium]|nr:SAM-dependent methyltransferase [Clostridiales bacterium]